jgi:2-methylcitrate dehydratase PrpD
MIDRAAATEDPTITLTALMAAKFAALHFDQLSRDVVSKAKLCLVDFLASAFASRTLPWSRQALSVAGQSSGSSTIVGSTVSASRADAAFANAVLGHGLVRDDMHLASVSHLGVVVFPPALAIAEASGASGRALIGAVVAGYEAGGKLGRAILDVEVARIHRPTGITGPVAGAVAAAKLRNLDASQIASAIAIAANTALGYNEWAATGGSEMFFHTGFAARNAVTAMELAAANAYASSSALDGPAGMLAAYGKRGNAHLAHPFNGAPEILEVFFKEVPACNFAQTAAQAARALAIQHSLRSIDIASVIVRVSEAAAGYPGCDAPGPFLHTLQAKMSIHYNVAAALLEQNFAESNYVPGERAAATKLAQSIVLQVDPLLTARFPAAQGAEVAVTLNSGRTLSHSQKDVIPASEALVRERFAEAASSTLGETQANALLNAIDGLESLSDSSSLLKLCRPGESQ